MAKDIFSQTAAQDRGLVTSRRYPKCTAMVHEGPADHTGSAQFGTKTRAETIALCNFATKRFLERDMGFLLAGSAAFGKCCAQPGHVCQ